jgi:hypothetical protein
MDDLSEDQKGVLLALGNNKVNAIYLAGLHDVKSNSLPKQLFPNSDRWVLRLVFKTYSLFRAAREQYITGKYVHKKFAKPLVNKALNNTSGAHRSSSFHEKLGMSTSAEEESMNTSLRTSIQNALAAASSETCLTELDETDIEKQALTALKQGDLAIMMRLIVSGFDLNGRIGTKYPLHVAVENVSLSSNNS